MFGGKRGLPVWETALEVEVVTCVIRWLLEVWTVILSGCLELAAQLSTSNSWHTAVSRSVADII